MIAPLTKRSNGQKTSVVQDKFLRMLPQIRRQAHIAFRGRDAESRHELTQEVVANAYCAFARMVHRGKQSVAYPTPLAQFAIRQVHAGRRVGSQLNKHDLLSPYARRINGFRIEWLDRHDPRTGDINEALVESHHAGPAEIASARIDVAAWLATLSRRHRRIAKALALGNTTNAVARQFGISPARISQLRRWFRQHWAQFQGEMLPSCSGA
jgi:hypothetical protein